MTTIAKNIAWPFHLSGSGQLGVAEDSDVIRQAIIQILTTRSKTAVADGELPWRPSFGCRVQELRYKNLDKAVIRDLATHFVAEALQRWEPRIRVTKILVSVQSSKESGGSNEIIVEVTYYVRSRAFLTGEQVVSTTV